ncbi:MAG: S1 RNA-binding domain-containing protein [Lachnospiraceae bacterium]
MEKMETMEDFKEELEASYRKIVPGDIVSGTVVDVNELEVTIDFNYYAPGVIPASEMSSDPSFELMEAVHVGDQISATVIKTDDGKGNMVLSCKEATDVLAWNKLRQMMESKTVIHGKIGGIVNAGCIMYVEGIRGFIPVSKLDLNRVEDTNPYLGREVDAIIITVDEEKKKLVLSVRDVLRQRAIEEKNAKIARVEVGNIVEGVVEKLEDYGAFVDIGDGISGLVHISQIPSAKKLKHPKQVMSVGDKVKVKISRVQNNKVSLTMKDLEDVTSKEVDEEVFDYKEEGKATTGLAGLLAGFKFD